MNLWNLIFFLTVQVIFVFQASTEVRSKWAVETFGDL
jgi:hypothetical protein